MLAYNPTSGPESSELGVRNTDGQSNRCDGKTGNDVTRQIGPPISQQFC
jgi:hypothetical protein